MNKEEIGAFIEELKEGGFEIPKAYVRYFESLLIAVYLSFLIHLRAQATESNATTEISWFYVPPNQMQEDLCFSKDEEQSSKARLIFFNASVLELLPSCRGPCHEQNMMR